MGIQRQVEINTGSEFDETNFFTLLSLFAFDDVPFDTFGKGAGNLSHENQRITGVIDNGGALVFRAAFGVPGYQVFAGVIFEVLDQTTDRASVHVYVERRHKNGNLQAPVVEVFSFGYFLDYANAPVCGCVHDPLVSGGNNSYRIAEKLHNNAVKNDRKHQDRPKGDGQVVVNSEIQQGEQRGEYGQCNVAFAV
jgi:hypothetical protein